MIIHGRAGGDTRRRALAPRRWALWSVPVPARSFLLITEITAVTLTIMLLVTQAVSEAELIRVAVLARAGSWSWRLR